MSGLGVFITSPAANATVGRQQTFQGSISPFNGSVTSITIQFGADGSPIDITPASRGGRNGIGWSWSGLLPNNVRPGQSFPVTVQAFGFISVIVPPDPDPEPQPVDGSATRSFTLENVSPTLTMNAIQAPISTLATSYTKTLSGTVGLSNTSVADLAVYGKPQVKFQVDGGALQNAGGTAPNWTAALTLAPGNHTITVQASDPFTTVTLQQPLQVLRYPGATTTDPNVKKTKSGIPTTSSVTTWTRLEPQCTGADIGTSTGARVFDPLWLMTRQWQMGEFQAEDTGSPVQARVRATTAPLTRYRAGTLTAQGTVATPYHPDQVPLEALVERRPMRPDTGRMLPAAVDAGLHFLRRLELDPVGAKYGTAFRTRYALAAEDLDDPAAARFVQAMAGRAPDARPLAAAFRQQPIVFDPALKIAGADVAAVRAVCLAWLAWYDGLFTQPSGDGDAWTTARLEYAASVAGPLADQPVTLSAAEFDGGRLAWSSFDVNVKYGLDTTGDAGTTTINQTTIPAPVVVGGAPAPRFWEVEDAKVAYGLLPTGPTDLAHLLLIEYASTYGNDWYLIPLTLPVGSLTRVDSLVVTDTFGVRDLLRPTGDPALASAGFSLWQPSGMRYPGEPLGALRDPAKPLEPPIGAPVPNLFFLAPSIGRGLDGATLEDVLFMRDEMADVAWAIEKSVESPVEQPAPRSSAVAPQATADGGLPRYLLSSSVPDNWIPLLPVELQQDGHTVSRLRRGGVLRPDGSGRIPTATGQVLNADPDLLLYDEEIPREGARVTTARRMARWVDGTTWVWTGLRRRVGRGEGSSALTFDELIEP